MIPKRPVKQEENVDAWLMSYADMITLLLCFFIIFVSVSEPKKDKISQIAEGMAGKFGMVAYSTPFLSAVKALQATVEENQLYKDVAVEGTSKSLSMELATHRFFKSGGAEIDEATMPVLQQMIGVLTKGELAQYSISIESHTSDALPQSGLYKNNWELSSVRAAKLAEYFIRNGVPAAKIRAVGYSDSRPKVPNLDARGNPIEENRQRNQRVTVRLE
ncbi:MAG: OmpA family protein [Alphaproteobacteria bacterium]|nr:OmpA family protein [Alphaproteobacteria bacterium]